MNDSKNKLPIFSTTVMILILLLLLFNLAAVLSGAHITLREGVPKWVWGNYKAAGADPGYFASQKFGSVEALKQLGLQLKSDRFLDEACDAFEDYLQRLGEKGLEVAPGIYASLANDYFDNSEFRKALIYFYKAEAGVKQLSDNHHAKRGLEEALQKDWTAKQMTCLEKLGRTQDADSLLEKKLSSEGAEKDDSPVLANLGNQKLTLKDFNREVQKLPPATQEDFSKNLDKRKAYFYQWIRTHLFYKKALRLGMDKEPEMLLKLQDLKFQLLAIKFLERELGRVDPTLVDLKNYYQSHLPQFTKTGEKDPKPFEEVKKEVTEHFAIQKQNEKLTALINKLMQEEHVRLSEENLI